jgi:hypothetical protein
VLDGALHLQSPTGQTAYSDLKFGSLKGLSIGYDCLDGKFTYDQTGIRTLNEVRLFEISLVAIPANLLAQVASLKSLHDAVRVVRAAADKNDDAEARATLRKLLSDLRPLLVDEDEDGDDESAIEDEKAMAAALREMLLELKLCHYCQSDF